LKALGVKGILIQAAEQGYITQLACKMPECFCPKELGGACYFEPMGFSAFWLERDSSETPLGAPSAAATTSRQASTRSGRHRSAFSDREGKPHDVCQTRRSPLVVEAVAEPADKSNVARQRIIVLTALAGVAISATAAFATATPVSPAPEATVTSAHPHFTWTLPTGEWSQGLYIASKPEVTPEGRFYDQNIVQVGVVVAADREWTPSVPLYAGSYWWNVWSSDPVSQVIFSTPAAFVIPVSLGLIGVKTKRYLSLHVLDLDVRWTSNVQRPLVRLRLLRGRKLVWKASKMSYNTIGVPGSTRFSWKRPTRLKRGTRLKLVASISSGGLKRARAFLVRAP
jgi:hypothetical protein